MNLCRDQMSMTDHDNRDREENPVAMQQSRQQAEDRVHEFLSSQ